MRLQARHSLAGLGAVVTWCASALAGSANYDFNAAPPADLQFVLSQADAGWRDTGGVSNSGYVALFDSINGQYAAVMIPDFDNGLIVKGFTFECELRIGNATGNDGRPADGFSVNYARANDPVVTQLAQEPPVDPRNDFAIPGAPEGGTTTGLSICFDTWSGNTWPSGETDIEGIILRVDNVTKAKVTMPVRNGGCADATSLQTGPYNPDLAGAPDELCWAPLKADLAENGEVTVTWKGTVIVDKVQTGFLPSAGRIVLAGRTGGANENTHLDNLKITTIAADKALVTGVAADALGVTVTLDDSGQSVVDQSTVALTVDGAAAAPLAFNKVDKTTTVRWNSPAYQAANQVLSLGISFKDTQNVSVTDTRSVTVAPYVMIPPAYAVPAASVNVSRPGFLMRPYQTEAAQPNTLIWTEEQLLGLHGANIADLTGATGGLFTRATVINFNMDAPNPVGNFSSNNGFEDEQFPGYPGTGGTGGATFTGNSAEEVLTYVNFPAAGLYQLGVNSDDGFRVTAGRAPGDLLGVILGAFDGGRGASDSLFTVLIDQPGYYPIRLIWENGNGELPGNGANLEFFSVKNGVKTLLNGTEADALKAYRESTAAGPFVSNLTPLRGATGVPADTAIMAEISPGSVQVDAATIKTRLNGTEIAATVTPAGAKTSVTLNTTGLLPSGATQRVTIEFSDKATPPVAYTTEWQFVVGAYVTLPTDQMSALGSEDKTKPGFNVKTWQLDGRGNTEPNNNEWAEGVLAGLVGPNLADLTAFTAGVYAETETINYAHTADQANGNFTPDRAHPGIPGTATAPTDNYTSEFVTYIPFDMPGYHVMGVNSDDNFRVTIGDKVGRQYIEVLAPAAAAGGMAAVVTSSPMNVNPGFGGPIPTTPIVADAVVLGTSCLADPALPDLTGKIAVIIRGTCTFVEKCRNAQTKGALAVVIANSQANEGNFPIVMGGDGIDITIPVMMVDYDDGQKLINNPTGLRLSIGKDSNLQVGEFNGNGRGASDTIFSFYVPQAGVYPFRCFYMQGGGGANVEWFTVKDGTRILVNDTAAGALKTYRARVFTPKPTISIAAQGGNVVLTFTGTLQQADDVTGPWADVTATSPHTTPASAPKKFYRSKM